MVSLLAAVFSEPISLCIFFPYIYYLVSTTELCIFRISFYLYIRISFSPVSSRYHIRWMNIIHRNGRHFILIQPHRHPRT